MAVKISPLFNDAQLDSNGNPYVGAQLFTYAAGSTTKQTTYKDSAAGTQHTNPIVLNARGEPPAPIWLTAGQTYKFLLTTPTDSDPPVTSIRSIDNVSGVNDTTTTIDQWVAGPAPTYVSATSFTLSGDQTSDFAVGRRLKTTNSGGTAYSTITASTFGVVTTVTVVNDSTTLDAGLSAVSYGLLSSTNPSTPLLTDDYPIVSGSADKTKKVRLEADGLTTATTRVVTVPDRNFTLDQGWYLLATAAASSSATIDFTSLSPTIFTGYAVVLSNVVPATDAVNLLLRVSQSAVFLSGASDYAYTYGGNVDAGSGSFSGDVANDSILLAANIDNAAAAALGGVLYFWGPQGGRNKMFNFTTTYMPNGNTIGTLTVGGVLQANTGNIDGLRFLMSSGNIASGTFSLYGIRTS